jgi:hypothetical protein
VTAPVVTVTPTIMGGTVARWYRDERSAENGRPVLSASRDGVMVHGEVYVASDRGHWHLPGEWIDSAREAHAALTADRRAYLGHLATHTHPFFGPLVPVANPAGEGHERGERGQEEKRGRHEADQT